MGWGVEKEPNGHKSAKLLCVMKGNYDGMRWVALGCFGLVGVNICVV